MKNFNAQAAIAAANVRLRAARAGCTIETRGADRLWIRGTFPDKKGVRGPYQQRIALKQLATPETVKDAEELCRLIGLELNRGTFNWRKFSDGNAGDSVGEWISRLEADRWSRTRRDRRTQSTWDTAYRDHYKGLDRDIELSVAYLKQELGKTNPDTCSRLQRAIAFAVLADFAGLDSAPLRAMKGSYSASAVDERELPTDDEIEDDMAWLQGVDPAWAWVFGTIATYGIRPHEIFYLEWDRFPAVRVAKGTKTGERLCVPLKPEWAEKWSLDKAVWPNFRDSPSNKQLGVKVSGGYRRLGVGRSPYDYRHAWAWRAHRFKLREEVSARFMGHSSKVHRETYKRWIGEETYLLEYQETIQRCLE